MRTILPCVFFFMFAFVRPPVVWWRKPRITAWRVPNLFRRFLGEGALSTSF